jgi:hypothetical protein
VIIAAPNPASERAAANALRLLAVRFSLCVSGMTITVR